MYKIKFLKQIFLFIGLMFSIQSIQAAEKFRLAWTLYPAYMPWAYASSSGIMDKWAEKYGIEVEIVQVNDYVEAINQYTAGNFDAATMATLDAMTIPAAAGIDSTSIAIMDYSNGNDVIILKDNSSLSDLKGKNVNLIEYSISHYFLVRALESVGLTERDINLVNTSDADMVSMFTQPSIQAIVTWNPMASEILKNEQAIDVFNSRQMPGELTDSIIVNSQTLKAHPELGKALIGAWYESLAIMMKDDEQGENARKIMAEAAGTDLAGFERQLQDTQLYATPQDTLTVMESSDLQDSMAKIAKFSFDNGLLGQGAESEQFIGISFPKDKLWGNTNNVKLRFDASYIHALE